jgi:hypothetical protein
MPQQGHGGIASAHAAKSAGICRCDHLRAHLQVTLLGAVKLFRDIDSAIAVALPRRCYGLFGSRVVG